MLDEYDDSYDEVGAVNIGLNEADEQIANELRKANLGLGESNHYALENQNASKTSLPSKPMTNGRHQSPKRKPDTTNRETGDVRVSQKLLPPFYAGNRNQNRQVYVSSREDCSFDSNVYLFILKC